MAEKAIDLSPEAGPSLKAWLFNPFVYIAGGRSLALGLVVIVLSACVGFIGRTHFDGVLDVHIGRAGSLSVFVLEGITDWLALAVALLFAGKIASRTAFRSIDIFGTQALARWPMLLVAIASLAAPFQRVITILPQQLMTPGSKLSVGVADGFVTALVMLITILAIVWMVALMYRAYSLCCNTRGARGAVSFVIALIAAEVVSKIVMFRFVIG